MHYDAAWPARLRGAAVIRELFMTTLGTRLYTLFNGHLVGRDEFGNRYYRRAQRRLGMSEKRWVIYNGIVEASKVPAIWHRWLHHVTDSLPNENSDEPLRWQKIHKANFTATDKSYYPLSEQEKYSSNKTSYYSSWDPNKV